MSNWRATADWGLVALLVVFTIVGFFSHADTDERVVLVGLSLLLIVSLVAGRVREARRSREQP